MIVLDTNVLSEGLRPKPSQLVIEWLLSLADSEVFTTAVTEAEIRYGLEILAPGKKRSALAQTIRLALETEFAGRVLPFDSAAARRYGTLLAQRRRSGRAMSHADAQIAAIAQAHGARLATRNVSDFAGCGIELINPWEHQA